ncbi:tripartite tricarboxylate transporter TctB family protein [Acuticoccus sp. M5D2P5]|uniref:tripartite tricarboxylate transporter TctB family protein n=1 Tax=Acuticoccus kalidii TaxID=2910977 RepID=UPI001F3C7C6E|nr:tripartite tricarboxylate transporter TctB family protein [Acuticoccus kalidii]MCF3933836.1 tripartite tricarboxylate transporter TctB family protein [Acuticoccus kalidii]
MGRIIVALAGIGLVLFMWNEAAGYPPTARQLPNLLGWVVLILAVLAIVQQALQWRRASADGTLTFDGPDWRAIGLGGGFLALVMVYAWSISVVGYLIATPVFLAVPLLVLRPIGLVPAVLSIAAVTAAVYGVFVWFLSLNIPLYPAF